MSYLSEVKLILRSILISSPVIINVNRLERDFREQEGISIPFEKLGYKTLLDFLNSIPDVLLVNGNSKYSDVILVHSEKSSHVNELVMKQRSNLKPGRFSRKYNKSGRQSAKMHRFSRMDGLSVDDDGYFSNKTSSVTSYVNEKNDSGNAPKANETKDHSPKQTFDKTALISLHNSNCNVQSPPKLDSSSVSLENQSHFAINGSTSLNNISSDSNQKKTRSVGGIIKYKDSISERKNSKSVVNNSNNRTLSSKNLDDNTDKSNTLAGIDISLKGNKEEEDQSYWRGGAISKSTIKKDSLEYSFDTEKNKKSIICNSEFKWIISPGQAMHKNSKDDKYEKRKTKQESKKQRKVQNFIPQKIQRNLQTLISDFPEGIYCSQLPVIYKNLIGEELRFEDYGYMYLINMCMDLNNIFHCVRESSSDYKLFDVKKPLPEFNTSANSEDIFEEDVSPETSSAIPEMIWGSFETYLPNDTIRQGYKMERVQVSEILSTGISVNVVVADIYDISKFWIIVNYEDLDFLMKEMQIFYKNNTRYLVPESLLKEGLYCVTLHMNEFHRAFILNTMPGKEYLKVYYFDYGTLGVVSKSEVWFLTRTFSELPIQAIRSRLSDIYPPYSGLTWSSSANFQFSNLTCMKKLVAKIERVDENKNLVDIKLRNEHSDISDILVDLGHAIFIRQTPKKHIDDPHCTSRVQYPHLFPTFDEIENWMVPSISESERFSKTPITIDFLYSQYFRRTSHVELIENIEKKMVISLKKKKSLPKQLKIPEEDSVLKSVDEMNSLVYGELCYKKSDKTNESNFEEIGSPEQKGNIESHTGILNIEDDEIMIGILRQRRMGNSASDRKKENDIDILKSILNESTNSPIILNDSSYTMKDDFSKLSAHHSFEDSLEFSKTEKCLNDSTYTGDQPSIDLIDLDVEIKNPVAPFTNFFLHNELVASQTIVERSTNSRCCLLTDPIPSGLNEVEHLLDEPIPDTINSIPSVDLIQFDDEISTNLENCGELNEDQSLDEAESNGSKNQDTDNDDCNRMNSHSCMPNPIQNPRAFLPKPFVEYFSVPPSGSSPELYPFFNSYNCFYRNFPNIPMPRFSTYQEQTLLDIARVYNSSPIVVFNYILPPTNPNT